MKSKIFGIITAILLSAGGAMYAVTSSSPEECPLKGTADCPLVDVEKKVPSCCMKK